MTTEYISNMTIKPDLTGYNYGAISTLVLKDRLISPVPANTDLTISGKLGNFDLTRYNYGSISSLVLTADRSELSRRDKEMNGAPTSLSSRIDSKEMAQVSSRATRHAQRYYC